MLKIFNLDTPLAVAYAPRLLSAIYAIVVDVYSLRLAKLYIGNRCTYVFLFILFTSWFSLFAVPRILANSLEAALFAAALYEFLKSEDLSGLNIKARILTTISFVARPTSLVPWVFIYIHQCLRQRTLRSFITLVAFNALHCALMIVVSIAVDCVYFGKLTWTAWNFFEFNVIQKGSSFYGNHGPFWFFPAGLPYIIFGYIPLFLTGIFGFLRRERQWDLLGYFLGALAFLSINAHKEERFLVPFFPIVLFLIVYGVHYLCAKRKFGVVRLLLFIGAFLNLVLASYSIFLFKRGSLDVMHHVRDNLKSHDSLYIFASCHQTPFHAFIHRPIDIEFPECVPRFDGVPTESQLMEKVPYFFIEQKLNAKNYTHLVLLSTFTEENETATLLASRGYKIVLSSFYKPRFDTTTFSLGTIELQLYRRR
eukprot:TRINITY_DN8728_c0_g1_i4.p1 TRINITY_DN8728_c0_g1~~TRINITY_DN8728_c0_g1_i4.p1  ORF type:complete len:423 (-),score=64.53 TRINITY_DN8728_c0_g1_i4:125-1393(-)